MTKISELVKKANPVIGTELLHLAWDAKSPQQAADTTAFLGYPRDIVQAVRWAAVIARQERAGEFPSGTFWESLGPPIQSIHLSIPHRENKCFSLQVFCKANSRWESLNSIERKIALRRMKKVLHPLGIRVKDIVINEKDEPEPHVRFTKKKDK